MVEMSLEHELAMYYREIATAIAFEFEINLRLLAMLRPGPHSRTGTPGSTRSSLSSLMYVPAPALPQYARSVKSI